jgi:hypothetical protein
MLGSQATDAFSSAHNSIHTIQPRIHKLDYRGRRSSQLQTANIEYETLFKSLDTIYTDTNKSIKCPFFRRRIADIIDNLAMVLKFLIIRHKSILNDIPVELLEVPGCKAMGARNPDGSVCKQTYLNLEELRDVLEEDWSIETNRGYYITGRLTSTIYRDDCLFDGPDPDMPVRGLRKYLAAASHLFEARKSFAKLHKLSIVDDDGGKFGNGVIEAHWELGGVLMLPWRPEVKPWSGWTRYHFDNDGLVAYHEEGWDISVIEAFIGTLFPELGEKIWERDPIKEQKIML